MTATTDRDVGAVADSPGDDIFWSLKTVRQKTGLSSATIYRYMALDMFPARRKLGPNRVGWLASEVKSWSENRPELGR
jgi:prophage regulatory protein